MKIASWNVNSIKARKDHVLRWLAANPVDVLMIQELKGEVFPEDDFKDSGYNILWKGQKAYNGVATFTTFGKFSSNCLVGWTTTLPRKCAQICSGYTSGPSMS